jgi:hypothetical protein
MILVKSTSNNYFNCSDLPTRATRQKKWRGRQWQMQIVWADGVLTPIPPAAVRPLHIYPLPFSKKVRANVMICSQILNERSE